MAMVQGSGRGRTVILVGLGVVAAGCSDKTSATADGGPSVVTAEAGQPDGATAKAPPKPKKLDPARCAAGRSALEALVKAAPKACRAHSECVEWLRDNHCGSLPVAKPFPPTHEEARFRELTDQVAEACPDEKCKWASLGVECQAGACVPSLSGRAPSE